MTFKIRIRKHYKFNDEVYLYNGIRNNQGLRLFNLITGKVIYQRINNLIDLN